MQRRHALLGCVQYVFENADRLQDDYGLQAAPALSLTTGEDQRVSLSQSQRILNGVFKRAYDNLRMMARERHTATSMVRKTVWAVRDRKEFEVLVAELRSFNDSLGSLFPDAQLKVAEEYAV